MFKSADLLLKIAQREKITLFGISAKYVDALRKFKPKLKYKFKLNKLRTICSTGSPLSEQSFKYVYQHIKKMYTCHQFPVVLTLFHASY